MLGPFGKVPDRVTGAIFHALVQCVAPRGSQLYQIQNPVCQLIAGTFVFALLPWALLAISLPAFSPSPKFLGWLYLFSEPPLQSCTQVPVSCLRSTAGPSGHHAREELSTPLALTSGSFSVFLGSPPSLSISFYSFFCVPLLVFLLPVFSKLLTFL